MLNDLPSFKIAPMILRSLEEDITNIDISTKVITQGETKASVELLTKKPGILSGFRVFECVFNYWMQTSAWRKKSKTEQLFKQERY